MTEKRIPLAGVIGSPVAHSLSPRLHRYWLQRYALNGHYVPMDIASEDSPDVLATLPKLGFRGINVTLPHKVSVLELSDIVSDRAALIGAANTLTFQKDGKIHADNTDVHGFLESLKSVAPDWNPGAGPATVIGAGGAARAILAALLSESIPRIRITNRTRSRADALKAEFGNRIEVVDWVQAGNAIDGAALVVNASSLGMTGKPDLRIPLDGLSPGMVVCDIVYTPLETTLLRRARDAGCVAIDGLGMLLYQAAPGFERWFGMTPAVDEDTRNAVLPG